MPGIEDYIKLTDKERESLHELFLKEPDAFYENAEDAQMQHSLHMTDKERFLAMTRLMKMTVMIKNAKIVTAPAGNNK